MSEVTFDYADSDNVNPVAGITAVNFHAADMDTNGEAGGINEDQTPEGITDGTLAAPISWIMSLVPGSQQWAGSSDDMTSPVFQGEHFDWEGVVIPYDGTWTVSVWSVEQWALGADGAPEASSGVIVDAQA